MSRLIPANPRSKAQIEGLALSIIRAYQPGVLHNGESFDVERFFDCELEKMSGVAIDYQRLEDGIYGYTDSDTMECVMSLDLANNAKAPHEKYFYRSTMAHETGHAILHVEDYRRKRAILRSLHKKNHELRVYREQEIILYRNPEWQAFRFAGALLMPEPAFRDAVREGLGERELSRRFGANPAFIRSRMKALKISYY